MRVRTLLLSFLVLLAVPVLSGPVAAAPKPGSNPCTRPYPPKPCPLAVSESSAQPGSSVAVSGSGFQPNSTVPLEMHSDPVSLGSVQTDAAGSFSTTVKIPADVPPGVHQIVATGVSAAVGAGQLISSATIEVVNTVAGASDSGQTSTLPTGIAVAALLAVGAVAVGAGRRKLTVA